MNGKYHKDNVVPVLSIVMPCFNGKNETVEMIESIQANDYEDWELIIVDDGSDEETLELLSYYTSDSRIKLFNRPAEMPKGAQSCRNMGMELARGEFVMFFDADDYVTPDCLTTRVQMLKERKDLDFIVFPSALYIDGEMRQYRDSRIYGYKVYDDDIAQFARRVMPFIVWNNIYRIESLRAKGICWDTKLTSLQDADFNLLTILAGLKYDYAQTTPTYGYRVSYNTTSISQQVTKKKSFPNHVYALRKFYTLLQRQYGRRYNADLFDGFQRIVFRLLLSYDGKQQCLQLIKELRHFDRLRYTVFEVAFRFACVLNIIISMTTIVKIIRKPYALKQKKRDAIAYGRMIQQVSLKKYQ